MNLNPSFREVATAWRQGLPAKISRRKGKGLSRGTMRIYSTCADRLIEHLGDHQLPVRNIHLRNYFAAMRRLEYGPGQMRQDVTILKMILRSVADDNGDYLFDLKINDDYCVTPVIIASEQNTPCATVEQIMRGLAAPMPVSAFVALAAVAGLRISEILALRVGDTPGLDSWLPETAMILVRATLKTPAAARTIILPRELNDFLVGTIKKPVGHRAFTIPRSSLYRELEDRNLPPPHSYRRFRVTHLRKAGMNEQVLRVQIGHSSGTGMTTRYDKTRDDVDFIRAEVERCGTGFALPIVAVATTPAQASTLEMTVSA